MIGTHGEMDHRKVRRVLPGEVLEGRKIGDRELDDYRPCRKS